MATAALKRLRKRVEALEAYAVVKRAVAACDVDALVAWLESQGRPATLEAILELLPADWAEGVRYELRKPVVVSYGPGERPTPPDAGERTVVYLPNKGDGGDLTALSDAELARLADGG